MNNNLIRAYALGILTGTVLTAGIVLFATPAKADPVDDSAFIATIEDAGITYTSRSAAITAGHSVCTLFDRGGTPYGVVEFVYENANGFTAYQAGYFVGASVGAYCDEYEPMLLQWSQHNTTAQTKKVA